MRDIALAVQQLQRNGAICIHTDADALRLAGRERLRGVNKACFQRKGGNDGEYSDDQRRQRENFQPHGVLLCENKINHSYHNNCTPQMQAIRPGK